MESDGIEIASIGSELNESLGALLLGLVISASYVLVIFTWTMLTDHLSSLFGVTNVQVFLYSQKAPRDPLTLKGIVS